MGAEVILQLNLTPTSDRELELVMCRANALFNQCFFISVNGVGTWGGRRSTMFDPDRSILQDDISNQPPRLKSRCESLHTQARVRYNQAGTTA